jgi:glycosyltransferase involved in cell wall biosynthesis
MRENEGLDTYGVGFEASVTNIEVVLSIIMPTYSEGPTARHAVRQVLSASYPCRTELVVVDNGSSDETAKQLDGLSCDRLKVCRYSRNRGKGAALLTGISLASGTHMVPFNADLEYSPTDVARMLEPVLNGRAEVVYGTRLFGLNTCITLSVTRLATEPPRWQPTCYSTVPSGTCIPASSCFRSRWCAGCA